MTSGQRSSSGDDPSGDVADCVDTEVDCDQVLDELQRFLDGEIGREEVEAVREHLGACYPCADRAEFERQFRLLVRSRCGDEQAPPGLADRIRACLGQPSDEVADG